MSNNIILKLRLSYKSPSLFKTIIHVNFSILHNLLKIMVVWNVLAIQPLYSWVNCRNGSGNPGWARRLTPVEPPLGQSACLRSHARKSPYQISTMTNPDNAYKLYNRHFYNIKIYIACIFKTLTWSVHNNSYYSRVLM